MEETIGDFRLSCVDANEGRDRFPSSGSFNKDKDLTNELQILYFNCVYCVGAFSCVSSTVQLSRDGDNHRPFQLEWNFDQLHNEVNVHPSFIARSLSISLHIHLKENDQK